MGLSPTSANVQIVRKSKSLFNIDGWCFELLTLIKTLVKKKLILDSNLRIVHKLTFNLIVNDFDLS